MQFRFLVRSTIAAPAMCSTNASFKPCYVDSPESTDFSDSTHTEDGPWVEDENDLFTNVNTKDQLELCHPKFRSGDPVRPLRVKDEYGDTYKYALNPTTYSVIFILLVELLERFSFNG